MNASSSIGPVQRHSKADVVAAALQLLDDQGLPNLSMRAIADRLGLQVSALYWHFPNKQTLLAKVSERLLERTAPGRGSALDVESIAVDFRDCLLAYRDAAELVSSSLALGLIDPSARRLLRDAISHAGLSERSAMTAAETTIHYVIGFVFHEQQRMNANSAGVAVHETAAPTASDINTQGDDFRAGLRLITAGIRATAAASKGALA